VPREAIASVAAQDGRQRAKAILAHIARQVAGEGREIRPHQYTKVQSARRRTARDRLEPVDHWLGVVAPEGNLEPGLFHLTDGSQFRAAMRD